MWKVEKWKKLPSNRIRTSDLEITANPLQSPALPTELSTVEWDFKISSYENHKKDERKLLRKKFAFEVIKAEEELLR